MTKTEAKEQVKNWMIEDIQSVLKGEKIFVEILFVRPNDIIEYVRSVGGIDNHDFDTNGWQWDFWAYVYFEEKKYMLSGDGYFGNSITFGLDKK